ncbi:MAG: sarcosine oxidase subunit gamma [Rubrimonas sp.]
MSDPVTVARVHDRGMILIRAGAPLMAAMAAALGLETPAPLRATLAGDRALVWFGPDEALALTPAAEVPAALDALRAAAGGGHALVLEMTDARVLFRLTGAGAREVLAKGAPVDLTPAAFDVGHARRTHLGQVACAFWRTDDHPETFELICFRSVADYVEAWLATAADPAARVGWF